MVLCKRVAPISFYFGGFDWASMLGIILCWALWYFAVFWWLCRAMRSDGFLGGRSELSYWFIKRSWYCDKWVLALEQCKLLILLRKKAFLLLFQAKNNSGGLGKRGERVLCNLHAACKKRVPVFGISILFILLLLFVFLLLLLLYKDQGNAKQCTIVHESKLFQTKPVLRNSWNNA